MQSKFVAAIPVGRGMLNCPIVALVTDEGVYGIYRVAVVTVGSVFSSGFNWNVSGRFDGQRFIPDEPSYAPYYDWLTTALVKACPKPCSRQVSP